MMPTATAVHTGIDRLGYRQHRGNYAPARNTAMSYRRPLWTYRVDCNVLHFLYYAVHIVQKLQKVLHVVHKLLRVAKKMIRAAQKMQCAEKISYALHFLYNA